MRVILAACFALALPLQSAWAQAPSPDASDAAQPAAAAPLGETDGRTDPPGSAPSRAAKEAAGRTGSLSPDEARRAARARARAAAAVQAAPDAAAKDASRTAGDERPPEQKTQPPRAVATRVARVVRPKTTADRHARDAVPRRTASARGPSVPFRPRRPRVAVTGNPFPRVGDYVPAGVPLFPAPGGYQPEPRLAEMGPEYGAPPRGFRPYPYPPYPPRYYYYR